MASPKRPFKRKLRGQTAIAQSLSQVVQETFRLWRGHHLGYDQTKYVPNTSWNGFVAVWPWNRRGRGIEQ
jgi:hypothetical protein